MTDPTEVARRLVDVLEHAGIPHAVGGAIALGFWSQPRGTKDVDINVFVPAEEAARALEALERGGLQISRDEAIRSATERGDARGMFGGTPVDLFFNSIPLHESAARRRRRVTLEGRPAEILSAEDLTILKLLFNRPKDWLDVEKLVAIQGSALERDYIRKWLVECVGEDDARTAKWDELTELLPAR